jgi:hypothetical protein
MILVLPHALPPAPVARELGNRLMATAPTLASWLASAPARMEVLDPSVQACTPLESWQLRHAGYTPPDGVPLGAGWSVLETGTRHDAPAAHDPIWLAAFVHLHVTQHGVTLTDPARLELEPDEAAGLLDTARPDLDEEGIRAEPVGADRLRLFMPESLAPYAPTLQAATGQEIQEWWPQGAASRPWRRVLNVVQMAWHDDPVNVARAARGKRPVNGLWLYGGGRPADFRHAAPAPFEVAADLSAPAAAGDWSAWLDAAARLEAATFAPLAARTAHAPLELVLTGEDRLCTLTLQAPRGLARWLPRRRHDWQSWWNAPQEPAAT